jgi:hypothetical protein
MKAVILRNFGQLQQINRGTRYRSWLRHYDTSQKVSGSISDEVIGIFNGPNPSSRTIAMGLTQSLTKISTRNFPWV